MKVIQHISSRALRGQAITLVWGVHPFPVGKILIALSAEGLCWLGFNCGEKELRKNWPKAELVEDQALTATPAAEIARLWPKNLERLSTPVVLYGTAFQLKVWSALLGIKPGFLVTYEDVARKIGKPKAVRAAASAVGKNPVSLVVPCHRVVNRDQSKVNYGWGADLKRTLLAREEAETLLFVSRKSRK
jgi:AraC family transcriptional regulator of adaptative response/methylated-DNA-[protein]-cysteine methyltransferase